MKRFILCYPCPSNISPTYGGALMNSEGGIRAGGACVKLPRRCAFYDNRRARPGAVEGIAVMMTGRQPA